MSDPVHNMHVHSLTHIGELQAWRCQERLAFRCLPDSVYVIGVRAFSLLSEVLGVGASVVSVLHYFICGAGYHGVFWNKGYFTTNGWGSTTKNRPRPHKAIKVAMYKFLSITKNWGTSPANQGAVKLQKWWQMPSRLIVDQQMCKDKTDYQELTTEAAQ